MMPTNKAGPHDITKTDWYYEERSNLLLVHEVRDKDGSWIRTDQIKIPWRKIEASLMRRKARKRAAAKKR
jgi:hypothetical protein